MAEIVRDEAELPHVLYITFNLLYHIPGTKKECTVTNNALFFIISIPYPGNII